MTLRIIHLLSGFFIGPFEFVDAQRVASDNQAVWFDQNGAGFEARLLRRVDFVGRAAIAFGIKVQQVVAERHPDFPGGAFDAKGGENALEDRGVSSLFLAFDLFARSLSRGPRFHSGVLDVLAAIAVSVVLAYR